MKTSANRHKKNNFYVKNHEEWESLANTDYCLKEPSEVVVVENGYILPLDGDLHNYSGGVCNAEKDYIAGHYMVANQSWDLKGNSVFRAYEIERETTYIEETVVYGGPIFKHFGHFIVESLSRMWWLLENLDCGYKFVFIAPDYETLSELPYIDYLLLLGLKREEIHFLKEPTHYSTIIVPDQTIYIYSGFYDKAVSVYNAIRDSVIPSPYEKIYLTRTKHKRKDCVNEKYFENYYRSLGYEIIAPEHLSIEEQVSIMAGAKKVVCISGSLHHQILFCQDGVDITVLNRLDMSTCRDCVMTVLLWINQARNANFTCVDVHTNFLPAAGNDSCYLLIPTDYWRQYVSDSFPVTQCDTSFSIGKRAIAVCTYIHTYIYVCMLGIAKKIYYSMKRPKWMRKVAQKMGLIKEA